MEIPVAGQIANLYAWALGIGGLIALLVLIYGGIVYTTSVGNESRISEAKEWVFGAVISLVILFGSYLILNTVNPSLTIFRNPFLEINEPATSDDSSSLFPDTVIVNPATNALTGSSEIILSTIASRDQVKALIKDKKVIFTHTNDELGAEFGYVIRETDASKGNRATEEVLIDPKIWQLIAYLTENGKRSITISSMIGTHSICAGGGSVESDGSCGSRNISHHWDGRAFDIAAINGIPVVSASAKADTIALLQDILRLQDTDLIPSQVIANGNGRFDFEVQQYQWNARGAGGHTDHVHIGY